MDISVVQTLPLAESASGTSKQSAAFGSAVTPGNEIHVALASYASGATYTVTDNAVGATNVYTQDKITPGGQSAKLATFSCPNINPGSSPSNFKITVTSSISAYISFSALEVANLTATADGSGATDMNTSTAPDTGTFSTTNAKDLLLALYMDLGGGNITITPPSGFTPFATETNAATFLRCQFCYQIVTTPQTNISPTWGLFNPPGTPVSETWLGLGFAYKGPRPPFIPEALGFSPFGMH